MTDFNKIADFVFELYNLKRLKHMGTKYAGVQNPDSLAEHVLVAAQIGYILAELEGTDTAEVMKIIIFHDNGEIRIGDHSRIADNYIDSKQGEIDAYEDQLRNLPPTIREKLTGLVSSYQAKNKSPEYIVARDADLLETMFQAKEYLELGYPVQRWLDNGSKYLQTESAKKLYEAMLDKSITDWWDNLNKA